MSAALRPNIALLRAARSGHVSVVHLLLADPRVDPDIESHTRLAAFGITGFDTAVGRLLEEDGLPPQTLQYALAWFVRHGYVPSIERLLHSHLADVKAVGSHILIAASAEGNAAVVRCLLSDERIDPRTPLPSMCTNAACGHMDIGADPRCDPSLLRRRRYRSDVACFSYYADADEEREKGDLPPVTCTNFCPEFTSEPLPVLGEAKDASSLEEASIALLAVLPFPDRITQVRPFFEPGVAHAMGAHVTYTTPAASQEAAKEWEKRQRDPFVVPALHNAIAASGLTASLALGKSNDMPVRVSQAFTAWLAMRAGVAAALRAEINTVIADAAAVGVTVTAKAAAHGGALAAGTDRRTLCIRGTSLAAVNRVRSALTRVLLSSVFNPPTPAARELLASPLGRAEVASLASKREFGSAYLLWDPQVQALRIFGPAPARDAASAALQALTERLLATQRSDELPLHALRAHDVRLRISELRSACGGGLTLCRVVRDRLLLKGSAEALDNARKWIEANGYIAPAAAAGAAGSAAADSSTFEAAELGDDDDDCCTVCLGPMARPFAFRGCGHGACGACGLQQFADAAGSKASMSIPWCCPYGETSAAAAGGAGAGAGAAAAAVAEGATGCGPVAVADLIELAPFSALTAIKDAALQSYIAAHPHTVRYCPVPGCNHLLSLATVQRATSEAAEKAQGGAAVIACEMCARSFCLACCERDSAVVDAHEGCTCADAKLGDPLAVHVRRVSETVLTMHCPSCSAAVLDWSGCMAVECNCGSFFCGFCFAACGTDNSAAHRHVMDCRLNGTGGYFVTEATIGSKHKRRRIAALQKYLAEAPELRPGSEMRSALLRALGPHLRDLGITESDVV